MRWAGIDEAGYGPNLGPLVLTAVVAEGADDRPPDVWGDLPRTVSRAGGLPTSLWIDDSKQVFKARRGLERLEAASLLAIEETGASMPSTLSAWFGALGIGGLADAELSPWLESGCDPVVPAPKAKSLLETLQRRQPFAGAPWRLVGVRSVLVGPARFNRDLEATGSKALAHFGAFAELLGAIWDDTPGGVRLSARSDKHGGRHFYAGPLALAFPGARIDRGPEGPDLSRYDLRAEGRQLALELIPRADAEDGLVALASMISKVVRERWMEVFNAFWAARIPGLRPTAGYPVDAARFRASIEPACRSLGLDPSTWWRAR